MKIQVVKFGEILISRPAGKEAGAVAVAYQRVSNAQEPIELDFAGVKVMGPSWLDEFVTVLRSKYGNRVRLLPSQNASVDESAKILGLAS